MYQFWKKKSQDNIKSIVFDALKSNVNYDNQYILGIPASYLDDKVFNQDSAFLKDAPFMSSLIQNPNHIGCHTLGHSERYFTGTQQIERELISICAVDIFKGKPNQQDGYVASGGTEANIQAIWVYRNYFLKTQTADRGDICILCSEDSHYSMDKAANLLALDIYKLKVDDENRELIDVDSTLLKALNDGKKYFIVVANMMTTMFGSVDNITYLTDELHRLHCNFKLHVDGAFGGFYYPFTDENSDFTFQNSNITSFTLDAHKMAQAPYGTGIFLVRKGFINYIKTQEASYIEGDDFTLIGSRSGANAIAAWMILSKNGPYGWLEKIFILQKRTAWLCQELKAMGIDFYRYTFSNIITIKSKYVKNDIANKFGLVPDNHVHPNWFKIVIMEHVTIEKLSKLVEDLKKTSLNVLKA